MKWLKSEDKQKELIPGGLAEGMSDDKFDKEQIERGIEVELEQTDDPAVAEEIAKDHLRELSDYYDRLEKVGL